MDLTPEEQELKCVIQRFMEGEPADEIYLEDNISKKWSNKW
jgi:hypothetical protein